jgi:hypothetical protein
LQSYESLLSDDTSQNTDAWQVHEQRLDLMGDDSCHKVVPNAMKRNCSSRWLTHPIAGCEKGVTCKCPAFAKVDGDAEACKNSGRKFDPSKLEGNDCRCKGPDYVEIDDQVPTFNCPIEMAFGNQDGVRDMVEAAREWCDASKLPEGMRVPPHMRGLYWMKDLPLQDVAFCTSLAEFDPETLTAKLAVWEHFVFRRHEGEKVPHLVKKAAHLHLAGGYPLTYTLKFSNDTLRYADIKTNSAVINPFINFPLIEVEKTPDETCVSHAPGDIFSRPCFFGLDALGATTDFGEAPYYAVRIMDGDGKLNEENYKLMQEAEAPTGDKFVRYAQMCDS